VKNALDIDEAADDAEARTPERPDRGGQALSGTNLERAGDYNQRVVLQAIRLHAPITRAELARTTGLTAPAVANITRRLIQLGLVAEAGKRRGGRGQPATRLVLHPDAAFSLGVNIDRDHISLAILDLQGRVRARATREGGLGAPGETAAQAADMLPDLLLQAGAQAGALIGMGIALPDALAQTELPDQHPHRDWAEVDAGALLAEALAPMTGAPLPAIVENDAAAAARGELQFGLGLRYASFFYVLISSGLGGGLVVDGEYFRGANGRSGEIGFLPIASSCTPARTLQEAVSLSALFAWLGERGVGVSAPDALLALGAGGRRELEAWLDMAAELLTEPLLAVSWLVNPAAILIGGRLPAPLVEGLASRLTENLRRRAPDAPVLAPVSRAAMAEDAPAVGAAILPFMAKLLPSRSSLLKIGD
jgi:predicted NBD/HSP70 family sugar kinase